MSSKKNIFISHIHEDDDGLKKIKSLADKNGMEVRDYSINSSNPNNAKSEEYIKYQILAPRINACSVLVVYITEDTKDSAYVNWEIEYAAGLGKRIVGVWAQGENGCEVPEALNDYADAVVGWNGHGIVDAINGNFSGWEAPNGTPSGPRKIYRVNC